MPNYFKSGRDLLSPPMDDRSNFRSKGKHIAGLSNENCNRFFWIATFLLWCSQMTMFYQTRQAFAGSSEVNVVPSSEISSAIEKLRILAKEMESSQVQGFKKVPRNMLNTYTQSSAQKSIESLGNSEQNLSLETDGSLNLASRNLKDNPSNDILFDSSEFINFDSQLKEFIYVYDLPSQYNTDLASSPIRWWSTQYEGEYELYDMIVRRNQSRTMDPEKATLFYVPFFSARYMLLDMKQDGPEEIRSAVQVTSKKWVGILTDIRSKYPYFNRSNGRDHFSTNTIDHGRCQSLLYCDPKLYGEMFFLQLNGDKMVRSTHAFTTRGLQALGYNYGLPLNPNFPDIACYQSDRDILMPPIPTLSQIQKPNATERKITALFRFSKGQHHGVPIPYFNHFIRKELLELYEGKNIPDWSLEEKSEWSSRFDWQNSKFCICPPGHSQWTSRPVKSIIGGCIPVNFYRDHDQPWQDEIEHSRFSLNVDADRLDSLKEVIDKVLATPGQLQTMQSELERVQGAFLWGPEPTNGARAFLMRALRRRAAKILKSTAVRLLKEEKPVFKL